MFFDICDDNDDDNDDNNNDDDDWKNDDNNEDNDTDDNDNDDNDDDDCNNNDNNEDNDTDDNDNDDNDDDDCNNNDDNEDNDNDDNDDGLMLPLSSLMKFSTLHSLILQPSGLKDPLNKVLAYKKGHLTLPGHLVRKQERWSVAGPIARQSSPPNWGAGLVHWRCLYWIPSPQVLEHSVQLDHAVYPPGT